MPPAGFGLLPVRSPLLRESSLFLGVLRCFSSPGALFGIAPEVPGRAPGGLPHSDIPGSPAASASPGHFAAWPRPSSAANAKASTMRPSCGYPDPPSPPDPVMTATADRHAPAGRCRPSAPPPGDPACAVPPWDVGVLLVCFSKLLFSARGRADTSTPAPPESVEPGLGSRDPPSGASAASRGRRTRRVPRGALSRCTTTQEANPLVRRRRERRQATTRTSS
jgi:hypothetical protein